jgi:hypothetical protein
MVEPPLTGGQAEALRDSLLVGIPDTVRNELTEEQVVQIESLHAIHEIGMAAGALGAGGAVALAGGSAVCIGLCSLIGGLLGWLLVMRKSILRCNSCGASIARE